MGSVRYTPAGVAALNFTLQHESTQQECGQPRVVNCQVSAVAFGDMAHALAKLPAGQPIAIQGFVASKSLNSDFLVVHVNKFKLD